MTRPPARLPLCQQRRRPEQVRTRAVAGLSREGSSEASVGAHRLTASDRERAVRYSFIVVDFHHLVPAGLPVSASDSALLYRSCNGTIVAGHSPRVGVAKPLAKGVQLLKSTIYNCDSAGIACAAYSYFSAKSEAQLFFQRAGVRVARRIGFSEGP